MKAEIKDKDKIIQTALRAAGYNVDNKNTELILNIVDYIREAEHEVTLREVISLSAMVQELYKEPTKQE